MKEVDRTQGEGDWEEGRMMREKLQGGQPANAHERSWRKRFVMINGDGERRQAKEGAVPGQTKKRVRAKAGFFPAVTTCCGCRVPGFFSLRVATCVSRLPRSARKKLEPSAASL